MEQLIKTANDMEYAVMVAGIDHNNEGSVRMHQKLGFTNCGTIKKAGYKFIDPIRGHLACGYVGVGHLADLKDIVKKIEKSLK